jgi:hypothetical protein
VYALVTPHSVPPHPHTHTYTPWYEKR